MSTVAEIPQEISGLRKSVQTWLDKTEIRRQIERIADEVVGDVERFITSDDALLVPRTKQEKENGFLLWQQAYENQRLNPWLSTRRDQIMVELVEAFRSSRNAKTVDEAGRYLLELAWLPIESRLRHRANTLLLVYAARGLALAWIGGHFGEALGVGQPQRTEAGWRVPVIRRRTGESEGTLFLSGQGEVLTTPAEFRALLR